MARQGARTSRDPGVDTQPGDSDEGGDAPCWAHLLAESADPPSATGEPAAQERSE